MKNFKRTNKLGLLLFCIILLGTACTKYLEEEPTSEFTADFVYTTADGLEAGVISLYNFQRAFFTNTRQNNGSNPIVIDARDDLTIPRGGEIGLAGRMSRGTRPDNSGIFSTYWRTYYQIVDRANALITAAEALDIPDAERKGKIIGQAKFFRANSLFVLYKLFNNIFVTTEPTTPENAMRIIDDKTPVADIYKQINDDLTFAIANLPWTDGFGRITQATARHLKAEVALWQKDWPEAKLQAEAVISNGAYNLVAAGEVFTKKLKNSETLWAVQMERGVDGGPHRINFNLMPNYAERIPGSKYSIEQGGRGFAWLTINNYLRDLLNAYGRNTDKRINGTYYIQDYKYNDPATIPAGNTIGEIIDHPVWKEFASSSRNRNFWFIRQNAGCKKYFPDDGVPTENNQYKNIMMARLAETFLYASEANLMLNNIGTIGDNATSGTALGQLNAVRNRAGIPKTSAINLDSLLNEQARELAFEGRRLYMLKRTGKLFDYVTDHAGYGIAGDKSPANSTAGGGNNTKAKPLPYKNDARRNMKPYMVNWPIPVAEITLLGPNYPQNDGYQ